MRTIEMILRVLFDLVGLAFTIVAIASPQSLRLGDSWFVLSPVGSAARLPLEWAWIYQQNGYSGDYGFTYFE